MLYFLEVTTAAFVVLTGADLFDAPERRFGLVLALAVAALAGALAALAETLSARRDRRNERDAIQRDEAAAARQRLVERARI